MQNTHRLFACGLLALLLVACGGGDPSPGAAGAATSREAAANVQGAPVYRFAKISTGAYFYTGNQWEADNIRDTLPDFRYEGIAFYQSDAASGSPVYRFANLDNGGYFYTASAWERDNTITNYPNMRYEGSTFSVAPTGDPAASPVYRVANLQNGAYLYTTNPAERDAAVALGFWRDEGSTFVARTTPSDVTPPGPIDDSYPSGRIAMIVPFAAGGPTDQIARNLAEALNQQFGRSQVSVVNVGGANGTTGLTRAAESPANGLTILLTNSTLAAVPTLYRSLEASPADLTPVGIFYEVPLIMAGAPGLPVANPGDLRAWLQTNPNSASIAHAGLASLSYLCALQYLAATQTNIPRVSYQGTAPATTDLLGNQVSLLCDVTTLLAQFIETDKAKGFGVTSSSRLDNGLGQVPTFTELSLPGMQMSEWFGLYVPKGTPEATVNKINQLLRRAIQDPQYIARHASIRGGTFVSDSRLSPAGHQSFMDGQIARWAPLIQAAGQYAD